MLKIYTLNGVCYLTHADVLKSGNSHLTEVIVQGNQSDYVTALNDSFYVDSTLEILTFIVKILRGYNVKYELASCSTTFLLQTLDVSKRLQIQAVTDILQEYVNENEEKISHETIKIYLHYVMEILSNFSEKYGWNLGDMSGVVDKIYDDPLIVSLIEEIYEEYTLFQIPYINNWQKLLGKVCIVIISQYMLNKFTTGSNSVPVYKVYEADSIDSDSVSELANETTDEADSTDSDPVPEPTN